MHLHNICIHSAIVLACVQWYKPIYNLQNLRHVALSKYRAGEEFTCSKLDRTYIEERNYGQKQKQPEAADEFTSRASILVHRLLPLILISNSDLDMRTIWINRDHYASNTTIINRCNALNSPPPCYFKLQS